MAEPNLSAALDKASECASVVDRLHKMCCEPDRSPRMIAITDTLQTVRADLDAGSNEALATTLEKLDIIGEAVGQLQVGCCTAARMPLYSETLTLLNQIQLHVSRKLGQAH